VGLDAATGQQRWARDGLRDPGDRAKAADGRLVLGAGAGGMVVLEVATGRTLWVTADTDVLVARADGIVLANGHGSTTVYDPASGRALGAPDSLGAEPDQVTVAPQIGPDHHVYLARGCPGRG
jgi:outer membrane protein assembly factor BamB